MEVVAEAENVVLKPKSELLDPNFEGYKLNLGKIPIHSKQIEQGVLQAPESDTSYSYQQVRLHALHNHLWQDPWSAGLNYYFSSSGVLHAAVLDESPGAASRLRHSAVLQLPASGDVTGPPAHPSLSLASDRLALLSDGRGALHVADTGDRQQQQPWQLQFSLTPLDGCGFVLAHSVLDPSGQLQVLAEHVVEKETVPQWKPDAKEVTFVNLLTWLTLVPDEAAGSGWRLARLRQAATSGTVHYACLEQSGAALCVAAERPATLIRDSERPLPPPAATAATADAAAATTTATAAIAAAATATAAATTAAAAEPQTEKPEPLYRWSQTADDVTVHLTSSVAADGLRVVLEPLELTVSAGEKTLLRGTLPAAIRRDESTWTVDDGRLELVLAKVKRSQVWWELLTGDLRGQEITDPDLLAATDSVTDLLKKWDTPDDSEDPESDKPGMVVGDEVEDCDDLPEHSLSLCRIDGDAHTATHQVSLSSHQYLMTIRLAAAEPPALCIRHDVDGLVWQPRSQDGRYQCEHVGTLQAFGFVQASKTQRKFMTCAPDLSYALICETSRHVFIYHQPSPVEGDLRNRKSGQSVKQVSRQQVVSLEDHEPILGVTAVPGAIYVLTASRLHALVLSSE